jgi:hypothetical protein
VGFGLGGGGGVAGRRVACGIVGIVGCEDDIVDCEDGRLTESSGDAQQK